MSTQSSAKRPSLILHSAIVLGCFWGLAALGMGLNPQSFWKFFTVPSVIPAGTPSLSYYWDIVFLTQDRLVSLGRYIFAQPFLFFALGSLYPHLDRRHQRLLWPTLMAVSSLYLIHQWIRYGNHQWLG